jgi:hypothetical protein
MLLSDIARCNGVAGISTCIHCARRQQIKLDDPSNLYSYMPPAIAENGSCMYFLQSPKENPWAA